MAKTVLKQLPDGDYIQFPEDYSGLDLLAEVSTMERRKLEKFVDKQVIESVQRCPRTRIPDDLILESPRALSSEDKGDVWGVAAADDSISPDSVLHSNKRTRPRETAGDDNTTNKKTSSLVAKKKKKLKNNKTDHHQGPDSPPAMPIGFRNKILQLAGPNAIISENLLIQKTLTKSDVANDQNRLSIPTKQLRDVKFLTDDEERLLSSRNGTNVGSLDNVMIIEPSLETSSSELPHVGNEKGKWQQQ